MEQGTPSIYKVGGEGISQRYRALTEVWKKLMTVPDQDDVVVQDFEADWEPPEIVVCKGTKECGTRCRHKVLHNRVGFCTSICFGGQTCRSATEAEIVMARLTGKEIR